MISNQLEFEKDWSKNGLPTEKIGFFKILGSLGKISDPLIVKNDPRANTFQAIFFYLNRPSEIYTFPVCIAHRAGDNFGTGLL